MAEGKKLTAKQLKFAQEYLKGSSATQAAIVAGYSEKTAYSAGSRLLKNVEVSKYISSRQQKAEEKTILTREKLLDLYTNIATFDIRRLYKPDGTLIPIHELDDKTAACICSIEHYEELVRGKNRGVTKKVKVLSALQAMEGAGKIIGAYEADNGQRAPVNVNTYDVSHLSLEQLKELKYGKSKS